MKKPNFTLIPLWEFFKTARLFTAALLMLPACEKAEMPESPSDPSAEAAYCALASSLKNDISGLLKAGNFEREKKDFLSGKSSVTETLLALGFAPEDLDRRLNAMEDALNRLSYSTHRDKVAQLIGTSLEKAEAAPSSYAGTPCYDAYQAEMLQAAADFSLCMVAAWEGGIVGALLCGAGYSVSAAFAKGDYYRCLENTY